MTNFECRYFATVFFIKTNTAIAHPAPCLGSAADASQRHRSARPSPRANRSSGVPPPRGQAPPSTSRIRPRRCFQSGLERAFARQATRLGGLFFWGVGSLFCGKPSTLRRRVRAEVSAAREGGNAPEKGGPSRIPECSEEGSGAGQKKICFLFQSLAFGHGCSQPSGCPVGADTLGGAGSHGVAVG